VRTDQIPFDTDPEQLKKVQEFKRRIGNIGVYYKEYSKPIDFERMLRNNLIQYIKDNIRINSINEYKITPETALKSKLSPEIKETYRNAFLNNMGVSFAHPKVDDLLLEDIYVPPDLKLSSNNKKKTYNVINISQLYNAIDVGGIKHVLIGGDVSGKTTCLKYIYTRYFDFGLIPVYLNGSDIQNNIRTDSLKKTIQQKLNQQYSNDLKIENISFENLLILIDDFHKSTKGKSTYWHLLISNLEEIASNIIITGSSLMPIDNFGKNDPFFNFNFYYLLEFGPKFRHELVNKWNSLGIDTRFFDKNELLRKNDLSLVHIKQIIGKNYVPSYPFYILALLQSLESKNVQNPNYSIHGFYYELLINDSLSRAVNDSKEISLYYNYLTHFCFHLFSNKVKSITIQEFDFFHQSYCDKFDLTYEKSTILKTFDKAKLFTLNNGVSVSENYIYYFFTAKYLSNNISDKSVRQLISKMCERLFRDEYSSIVMFLTHLSKDSFIINELIVSSKKIFADSNVCRLDLDISLVNQLVEFLPEQILEQIDVLENRNLELEEEEINEKVEKQLDNETTMPYDDFSLDDDVSTIDFMAEINNAVKTIDLLGQVVKKHWGELDGDQKYNLVYSTYELGLRTLDCYLSLVQKNADGLIEHLSHFIEKKHIKDRFKLKKTIEETSREYIFRLCFISSFGIIKRISNSVGYDKLKNSFDKILKTNNFNSVRLIDTAIKLSYSNIGTHIDLIKSYKDMIGNNKLSTFLLQNLVIDYMYMYETDHKTKSTICNYLNVSVKEQIIIDSTSKIKKK
jgi:hypothetical protein